MYCTDVSQILLIQHDKYCSVFIRILSEPSVLLTEFVYRRLFVSLGKYRIMISNLTNISGTSSPRIERSEQCCPSGSVTNSTPNIEAYRYPTLFVGYLQRFWGRGQPSLFVVPFIVYGQILFSTFHRNWTARVSYCCLLMPLLNSCCCWNALLFNKI